MIRGAIFDADGTLFDSMGIWTTVGSDFLRSLGDYEPEEDINERFKSMSLYQSACYYREVYNVPHSIEEISEGINKWVVQKVTDDYIKKVEELCTKKEKELSEI